MAGMTIMNYYDAKLRLRRRRFPQTLAQILA